MRLPILCAGQCVAWGTLYYGLAFVAPDIGAALHVPQSLILTGQSGALLLSGLLAPSGARFFARFGSRTGLTFGSATGACAFLLLAVSDNLGLALAAILLTGVAMTVCLYEAAFVAAKEGDRDKFPSDVLWIAVIGGFASTVFWPLSSFLSTWIGWRLTVFAYACILGVLSLTYALCLRSPPRIHTLPVGVARSNTRTGYSRKLVLLGACFALTSFVSTAVSSNIANVWDALAVDRERGSLIGSLMGPAQVLARIYMHRMNGFQHFHSSGKLILCGLAISFSILFLAPYHNVLSVLFILLFATSNGLLTIMRAFAFQDEPDSGRYASSLASLSAGTLFTRALAPGFSAWILEVAGIGILALFCMILAVLALGAFSLIRPRDRENLIEKNGKTPGYVRPS